MGPVGFDRFGGRRGVADCLLLGPVRVDTVSSIAPNKANFRRFWAKNASRAKEQSQSKPIYPAPVQAAARYIRVTRTQLIRMMDECDVEYFSDIDRVKAEAFLTRQRNQGLGARTYNAYLKTGKSF